jgi:hypothetical protein
MAVPTSVDIPKPLHDRLRNRAKKSGASIRSQIVHAIEQAYPGANKSGEYLTRPLIQDSGKLGPAFPVDKNLHDFVFSGSERALYQHARKQGHSVVIPG